MKGIVLLIFVIQQTAGAYYEYSGAEQDLSRVFDFAPTAAFGVQQAAYSGKPIMLIMLMTNCRACTNLKSDLIASEYLKTLAKEFVVIQSENGSEPWVDRIQPDNKQYFPRIVFMTANQTVLTNATNASQPRYPYYYKTAVDVIEVMKQVLALIAGH